MASQINATTINANYPVAGQDNDSQGFRDNFSRIKVALTTASSEITVLQQNTAKLNETNDFDGNTAQNIILQNFGTTVLETDITTLQQANPCTLYFNSSPYHKVTTNTSTAFMVENWPLSGVYSVLRLSVSPSTSSHVTTMTFVPAAVGGKIYKEPSMPMPLSLGTLTNRTTVFDLWSSDGGENVFVKFIGTFTSA